MIKRILLSTVLLCTSTVFANTQCFIVMENQKIIQQQGDCQSRHAPNSTFKIPISVMGYDDGFLKDATTPTLAFQKGYADWLDVWKQPHHPTAWMKNSCVWYSQVITQQIGMDKFKKYLASFNYGNQDASGDKGMNNGLTRSWLSSSLQISPKEQIEFLQKLISNQLPVSQLSHEMTKQILFMEEFHGWKLYGKTGSGHPLNDDGTKNEDIQTGWFIGWISKDDRTMIFAHYIEDNTPSYGGPRAREAAKQKLHLMI